MTRVGFIVASSSLEWFGGLSYLRNLFLAINSLPDRCLSPVIITTKDTRDELLNLLPAVEIIRSDLVATNGLIWKLRRFLQSYIGRDFLFERFLKRHNIQILSHSGYLGCNSPIPSLSWIPDFQELTYPEFFSEYEFKARVKSRKEIIRHSSGLILSSFAAKKDLDNVENLNNKLVDVLHFVASVPNHSEFYNKQQIVSKYNINDKYFIIPNQFWVHKNHVIVIEALNKLKKKGKKIQIVATGNTHDHRHPDHFKQILNLLKLYDLEDDFRILGPVPYMDLMTLIHESIGLINPSLFEGWSTSVEEAKSLGKTVVLSNIPVHVEQAPSKAFYFDPHDSSQLSSIIQDLWNNHLIDRKEISNDFSVSEFNIRRLEFAKQYRDIIFNVIKEKSK